jgi:hypothetical protein
LFNIVCLTLCLIDACFQFQEWSALISF